MVGFLTLISIILSGMMLSQSLNWKVDDMMIPIKNYMMVVMYLTLDDRVSALEGIKP